MSDHSTPKNRPRRRIKLIQPGWQLRMISAFAGIACLAFMATFLLLAASLSSFAARMPEGSSYLAEEMPGLLWKIIGFSFLVLLPAVFTIGILVTFRTAGPLYRFKTYLKDYTEGKVEGPCALRKGDELHDLCDLINAAIAHAEATGTSEPRDAAGNLSQAA